MKTLCIACLLSFVLMSCSQHEKISNNMKSWVGKSESQLVQSWGAPTRVYKLDDGSKVVTYVLGGGDTYGTATRQPNGSVDFTQSTDDERVREFTIDRTGTITNWRWHGQ